MSFKILRGAWEKLGSGRLMLEIRWTMGWNPAQRRPWRRRQNVILGAFAVDVVTRISGVLDDEGMASWWWFNFWKMKLLMLAALVMEPAAP